MKHIIGLVALAIIVVGLVSCPIIPVTGVTLNATDWTVMNGGNGWPPNFTQQLVATVVPENATNKRVTWQSSDESLATVSSSGLVTWVGTANSSLTVTATTVDGGFTATCSGSASCPILYVGDGTGKFTYLTDLQGPIIGMPPGAPMLTRTGLFTYDYVVLKGLKADLAGNYQLKLREVQPEITYLDDLKLIPVDVPDGYNLASSSAEQTYGNGYANAHRFYTLKDPRTVVSATDWNGKDVTAQLKSIDGAPAPVEGSEMPFYTLDFGSFDAAHAKLLVEAWTLYSSAYASKTIKRPSVEVKDAAGEWTEVKTFGLPAGDEKTMVFDISGMFPTEDRHIRLNLGSRPWVRWLIDSVRLDDSAPINCILGSEVQPLATTLSQGGRATIVLPDIHSRGLVLDDNLPFNGVGFGQGKFTSYGDVNELVARQDDKFVIFGMGDQVLVTFGPMAAPRPGYHRILVLKILQYYKAYYVNTVVNPLPFRGMSSYPYPATENYPKDADHKAYLAKYNTRENK
jgi:hypothetical protein